MELMHLVWLVGLVLDFSNDTKTIDHTFKKMWGLRLEAICCAWFGISHLMYNNDEVIGIVIGVLLMIGFISNAIQEAKVRAIFVKQFEKWDKGEN